MRSCSGCSPRFSRPPARCSWTIFRGSRSSLRWVTPRTSSPMPRSAAGSRRSAAATRRTRFRRGSPYRTLRDSECSRSPEASCCGLSAVPAAALTALLILAPLSILVWIPSPGPDRRLVGESFRQFLGDLWTLIRRREVLIAIALFAAPCATFSLTNMVGGFGADFSVSPRIVGLLGGAGITVAGVFGSLMLPPLARRMSLRTLYLTIGVGGSIFTMLMLLLPHVPSTFALLVLGENAVQACAIA